MMKREKMLNEKVRVRYEGLEKVKIKQQKGENGKSIIKPKQKHRFIIQRELYGMLSGVFSKEIGRFQNNFKHNLESKQSLNPIYKEIEAFPCKLYLCGYCKAFYAQKIRYLIHCQIQKCPINHERSTHFFYLKNNVPLNSDNLSQYLSHHKQLFKQIKQSNFVRVQKDERKQKFYIRSLNLQIRDKQDNDKIERLFCRKCGYNAYKKVSRYVDHCLHVCFNPLDNRNSHTIKRNYEEQSLIEFVEDVNNLLLTYNIFILFQGRSQYLLTIKNQKINQQNFTNTNEYYCQNCKYHLKDENSFIKHVLFQCSKQPNKDSSHRLVRKEFQVQSDKKKGDQKQFHANKIVKKVPPNKQDLIFQDEKPKQYAPPKQQKNMPLLLLTQNNIQTLLYETFNQKWYSQLKNLFKKIYFCGQCNNQFQDKKDYLIHYAIFDCSLYHDKNSHFYYNKNSNKRISNALLLEGLDRNEVKEFVKRNEAKLNKMINQTFLMDKNGRQICFQNKIHGLLRCGQCNQQFRQKELYFNHIIKTCFSFSNGLNSHKITLLSKITKKQFQQFIYKLIFAINLTRFCPNTIFKLIKNSKTSFYEPNEYYCGCCENIYWNEYEYVYHSLSVCQSERNEESSLFVEKIQSKIVNMDVFLVVDSEEFKRVDQIDEVKGDQIEEQEEILLIKPSYGQKGGIQNDKKVQKNTINRIFDPQISQKNQSQLKVLKPKYSQIHQKLTQTKQTKRKQHKSQSNQIQKLFSNLDFPEAKSKKNYYCHPCRFTASKLQDFIEHLKSKSCLNYQNEKSSHFLMPLNDYKQMIQTQSLNLEDLTTQISRKDHLKYKKERNNFYLCGCGSQFSTRKYIVHMNKMHQSIVPEGSSHVVVRIELKNNTQNRYLLLALQGINSKKYGEIKFVCSCNVHKYFQRQQYVHHVMKKHKGISPMSYMRKLK